MVWSMQCKGSHRERTAPLWQAGAVSARLGTLRQVAKLRAFTDKFGSSSPCGRVNGYPKTLPAAEFLLEEPLAEELSHAEPMAWHPGENNSQAFVNGGSSAPLYPNGSKFSKGGNGSLKHSNGQDVLREILEGHGGHNGCSREKGMNGDLMNGGSFVSNELSLLHLHELDKPVLEDYWIPQVRNREPGTGAVFAVEMHVRDYELDQYGVVNHSIFINYLDHARHEFLTHIGLDPDSVAKSGNALAIVRQELKYSGPLRSRDKFRSTIFVSKLTKARCIWTEEIWKIGEEEELVASAETEGLCLDKNYRPIRVPAFAVENLNAFSQGSDVCIQK